MLDYLGGPYVITSVLTRERQERQSEGRRCEDGDRSQNEVGL